MSDRGEVALVLSGGGARGAYQVGLLRYLAKRYPDLQIPILVGVSAGAVNAAHLAHHQGTFAEAVHDLGGLWTGLEPETVFKVGPWSLFWKVLAWSLRLLSGGAAKPGGSKALVDTKPLGDFLRQALDAPIGEIMGIGENLQRGRLRAVALTATSYTTGQTVTWIEGRDIHAWERPKRRGVQTRLTVDHVMASSALPLLFPAVRVGNEWYGDGGIRQTAPLSPALHLGAQRILVISTRYQPTTAEATTPKIAGYPPPAQVMGLLYNAIFLDLVDQDVQRLELGNSFLRKVPPEARGGMRVVEMLVLRPSRDMGRLAREYEAALPKAFRFMARGLGTRETASSDLLSLMMFHSEFVRRLIEMGEADAEARADELERFFSDEGGTERPVSLAG